jgi:hypothetical protein
MRARLSMAISAVVLALVMVGASPARAANDETTVTDPVLGPLRRGHGTDLNLELGLGRAYDSNRERIGTAKLRLGGLWIYEPWFPAFGMFVQVSSHRAPVTGVEVELMHLWSGLWTQVGVGSDFRRHTGCLLSAGLSVVGVQGELWRAPGGRHEWAVLGKLRLPLGVILLSGS